MNGGTYDSQARHSETGWNPWLRLCFTVVVLMLLMVYVTAVGLGVYLFMQAFAHILSLTSVPTPLGGVW